MRTTAAAGHVWRILRASAFKEALTGRATVKMGILDDVDELFVESSSSSSRTKNPQRTPPRPTSPSIRAIRTSATLNGARKKAATGNDIQGAKSSSVTEPPPAKRPRSRALKAKDADYTSLIAAAMDQRQDPATAGPPDWSTFTLKDLQEEARFWGHPASASRAKLEQTLGQLWEAMQHVERSASDAAFPSPSRSASSASSSPDSTPFEPPRPTLACTLQSVVQNDHQLYDRILLYEPVPFEEVWSSLLQTDSDVLKATARGTLQSQVKAWLDLQGIVWYEGEIGGNRSRW